MCTKNWNIVILRVFTISIIISSVKHFLNASFSLLEDEKWLRGIVTVATRNNLENN